MERQLNHQECKQRQKQITNASIIVLENLEHSENIGSAFRIADAFNFAGMVIISTNDFNIERILKTARSCERHIPYLVSNNAETALNYLNENGFTKIALEITNNSKPLREINFAKLGKVALIVGNERRGISKEFLSQSDKFVHIDMYGKNSSMNVATALAIACYKITEDILT